MRKIIILFGRPGSGKGTQAELLKERLGFFHFQTSKMIRDKLEIETNDPEVKEAKEEIAKGDLVSTQLVAKWVLKEINSFPQKNIVFDGSPRTLYEAKKELPVLIKKYNKENVIALNIEISPRETIWRNTHRRICSKCENAISFTLETKNLKKCPKCGGNLKTRIDDKEDIIKERLAVYELQTEPILKYFNEMGILKKIDGSQMIESVYRDIVKAIT